MKQHSNSDFFNRRRNNLVAAFRGMPTDYSRARFKEPTNMEQLMDKLVHTYSLAQRRPEEIIREHWPAIVGDYNARHADPVRLDRGQKLFVQVSNSVVRQELFFSRKLILRQLQQLPGCSSIRQVIFRAG